MYVDERGRLQAFRADRTASPGIFFDPDSTTGDAGFFLAFPAPGPGVVYGFSTEAIDGDTADYALGSQQPTTGTGSAADPLRQVTSYSAPGLLGVTQTTTYVNGAQQFRVHWTVTNLSGGQLAFKAIAAADFYFDGSDRGTGIYTAGPPQFVGGTNADTGNAGGFEEVPGSGWSAYEALAYGPDADQVWGRVAAAADSPAPTLATS